MCREFWSGRKGEERGGGEERKKTLNVKSNFSFQENSCFCQFCYFLQRLAIWAAAADEVSTNHLQQQIKQTLYSHFVAMYANILWREAPTSQISNKYESIFEKEWQKID